MRWRRAMITVCQPTLFRATRQRDGGSRQRRVLAAAIQMKVLFHTPHAAGHALLLSRKQQYSSSLCAGKQKVSFLLILA